MAAVKRSLFILGATLLSCLPAMAAFTFVNAQGANSSSSSSLATATWSSTTGDTVVCSVSTAVQTLSTLTDVNSGALTIQATVNSTGGHEYLGYIFNITANASYKVTAATSGGPNELSIACAEFTPPASTTVSLDQTNTATGSSTAASVSVTSVTAGDLVIGGVTFDVTGVPTAGSGYTIPTNGIQPATGDVSTHQPTAIEYNLNATGGTTTVNFTVANGSWGIRGTAFKATATGGAGPGANKRKKLEQLDEVNLRRNDAEKSGVVSGAVVFADDRGGAERSALSGGKRVFGLGDIHGESFRPEHAGIGQPDVRESWRDERRHADADAGFWIHIQRADDRASVPGNSRAVHRGNRADYYVQRDRRNADGELSRFAAGHLRDVCDLRCAAGERARFEYEVGRVDQLGGRLQRVSGEHFRGPYTKLNTALVSGLSYSDKSVVAGKTYFYVVTAADAAGNESVFSNEGTGKITTP